MVRFLNGSPIRPGQRLLEGDEVSADVSRLERRGGGVALLSFTPRSTTSTTYPIDVRSNLISRMRWKFSHRICIFSVLCLEIVNSSFLLSLPSSCEFFSRRAQRVSEVQT